MTITIFKILNFLKQQCWIFLPYQPKYFYKLNCLWSNSYMNMSPQSVFNSIECSISLSLGVFCLKFRWFCAALLLKFILPVMGTFFSMNVLQMSAKVAIFCELFLANIACERFCWIVFFEMFTKIAALLENGLAAGKLTLKVLLEICFLFIENLDGRMPISRNVFELFLGGLKTQVATFLLFRLIFLHKMSLYMFKITCLVGSFYI